MTLLDKERPRMKTRAIFAIAIILAASGGCSGAGDSEEVAHPDGQETADEASQEFVAKIPVSEWWVLLKWRGQADSCLDGAAQAGGRPYLFSCNVNNTAHHWRFALKDGGAWLLANRYPDPLGQSRASITNCLDGSRGKQIYIARCQSGNPFHQWKRWQLPRSAFHKFQNVGTGQCLVVNANRVVVQKDCVADDYPWMASL